MDPNDTTPPLGLRASPLPLFTPQKTAARMPSYRGDTLVVLDASWAFVRVDSRDELLFGRPSVDLIGKSIWAVFPELAGTAFELELHDAVANQAGRAFEVYHVALESWFSVTAAPLPDGLAIFFRNSAARKTGMAAAARLVAIVESSTNAIIAANLDGIITDWNNGAARIYGYSPQEAIGNPLTLLLPPDRAVEMPIILDRLRRGERTDFFETVHLRKDGELRHMSVNMAPILDRFGDLIGVSSIGRDITERKASTTGELDLLGMAVQQSTDAIAISTAEFDGAGPRIQFVNPAFARMTGYSEREIKGESPSVLYGPHTEQSTRERVRDSLLRGERCSGEWVNYRKDGSEITVEFEVSPLTDAHGAITHIVATHRDVSDRREAQEQLERQFHRLEALRSIDASITARESLDVTLKLILDHVLFILQVDAAAIFTIGRSSRLLELVGEKGFAAPHARPQMMVIESGPAGQAVRERRTVGLGDSQNELAALLSSSALAREGFTDYRAVPLLTQDEARGAIEMFQRSKLRDDPDSQEFLAMLANQAALAIDNAGLIDDLKYANRNLVYSYDATIEALSRAIDLRDSATQGHSIRVADLAVRIAHAVGVSDSEIVHIRRGALLHDVGKLGVPDSILLKPGALNDEELAIMRRHPEFAYDMLYSLDFLRPALAIPVAHHEWWNGTGYPHGLKGEEIPLAARIFAVADVWDALLSDRPYRAAWSREATREHIQRLIGSQFDPTVAHAFLSL